MLRLVARCFYSILAKRIETFMPCIIKKKAFRAGDGTTESVWLLQKLIGKTGPTYQNLIKRHLTGYRTSRSLWPLGHLGIHRQCFRMWRNFSVMRELGFLSEPKSAMTSAVAAGSHRLGKQESKPKYRHLYRQSKINICAFTDRLLLVAATPLSLKKLLVSLY